MLQKSSAKSEELERFDEEVGRMLQVFFPREHQPRPRAWRPPTDVYETEELMVVQMEIAGINPDELTISYSDRLLSIRGRRNDPRQKTSYHRMEIAYGEFGTDLLLPGVYVQDKIEAKYENGFLIVTLPKEKPFSIPVQRDREE